MSCSAQAPPLPTEDSHRVIRTRQFYRNRRDLVSFLSDILSVISSEHASGQLQVDFSQGGFGAAKFVESTALRPLP